MTPRRSAPAARIEDLRLEDHPQGLQVSVTIRNTGAQPIFATTDLRRIEVDAAARTVGLWFSDHGRDLAVREPGRREYTVPRAQPIEPGQAHAFQALLPRKLKRLVAHADRGFHVEVLDLSGVVAADVHCCVADRPFYFNPKGGPLLAQLAGWGDDLPTRAVRRAPPAPGPAAR
jgi:hypothetical protein